MNRLEIISKETKEIHDKIYNVSNKIKKEIIIKICDFVINKTKINLMRNILN